MFSSIFETVIHMTHSFILRGIYTAAVDRYSLNFKTEFHGRKKASICLLLIMFQKISKIYSPILFPYFLFILKETLATTNSYQVLTATYRKNSSIN